MAFSSFLILTFILPSVSLCLVHCHQYQIQSSYGLFSIKILKLTSFWRVLGTAPSRLYETFLDFSADDTLPKE
jgi:hypothetical protein